VSRREPSIGFSLRSLRQAGPRDLAIRFTFGAAISAGAAMIAILANPRFAGVFLAFPAILPATLTLIERKASEEEAIEAGDGAILGAAALILFGGLVWWLVPRIGAPSALVVATAGWLLGAVTLYLILRLADYHRSC
jgi:hypothetical protein